MKWKLLLLTAILFSAAGTKAQVTVDVFIDGTKAGQYNIKKNQTDSGGIAYSKKNYRNMDRLTIQVSGKGFKKGYFKKVEVTDGNAELLLTVDETLGAEGQFVLTDKALLKRLKNGKPVELYLVLTPGNTLSKEKPVTSYIGTLTRD